MSNVRLRNLGISHGRNEIIRGLELTVEEGEFLVLLGPSGCGKSTLLHSIAGLVEANSGSVEIGGRDMTHADPSERGIGMVFQSYALYPTMTVEGNMSFGLRVAGTPKAEIKRRVARAADMLQLAPLLASSRPAMACSRVDLPQPEGPSSTRNSPSSTSRSRCLMISLPPWLTPRSRRRTFAIH